MAGLGVVRAAGRQAPHRGRHGRPPCRPGGRERPARVPPLTSLVSVLNLRFWMVLLSWMLVSNFIIWF